MNAGDLFDAIGQIDGDLVDFAEEYDFKARKRIPVMKYLLTAAAILLVVGLTPGIWTLINFMADGMGATCDEAAPEARDTFAETGMADMDGMTSEPENAMAPDKMASGSLLAELRGEGAAKLVCNVPDGVKLTAIGMTEIEPGVFEIKTDGEWVVKLLIESENQLSADEISFELTSKATGKPLEAEVDIRQPTADDAKEFTN